jgi:hypothetical protein
MRGSESDIPAAAETDSPRLILFFESRYFVDLANAKGVVIEKQEE